MTCEISCLSGLVMARLHGTRGGEREKGEGIVTGEIEVKEYIEGGGCSLPVIEY